MAALAAKARRAQAADESQGSQPSQGQRRGSNVANQNNIAGDAVRHAQSLNMNYFIPYCFVGMGAAGFDRVQPLPRVSLLLFPSTRCRRPISFPLEFRRRIFICHVFH